MKSIMAVTAVLQSVILLDRHRIDQVEIVALLLQSIDQPVPVKGRLNGDTVQALPEG